VSHLKDHVQLSEDDHENLAEAILAVVKGDPDSEKHEDRYNFREQASKAAFREKPAMPTYGDARLMEVMAQQAREENDEIGRLFSSDDPTENQGESEEGTSRRLPSVFFEQIAIEYVHIQGAPLIQVDALDGTSGSFQIQVKINSASLAFPSIAGGGPDMRKSFERLIAGTLLTLKTAVVKYDLAGDPLMLIRDLSSTIERFAQLDATLPEKTVSSSNEE